MKSPKTKPITYKDSVNWLNLRKYITHAGSKTIV